MKNKQSLNQSEAFAYYHQNDISLSFQSNGGANMTQPHADSYQKKLGHSQGSKKADLQIQTQSRGGYENHVRQSSTRNSMAIVDPRKLSIKNSDINRGGYPQTTKYKSQTADFNQQHDNSHRDVGY